MDWTSNVAVHESASPAILRQEIAAALKENRVHPHLLYSGLRQSFLWMALHRAFSPAQRDESCVRIYDEAFDAMARSVRGNVVHVVSLACGDGSKDIRCLEKIRESARTGIYTPVDISLDLVLTAIREASAAIRGLQTTPLLCNLPRCSVLPAILKGFDPSGAERIILFLGTIHNYWPPDILRSVLYPLRAQDQLLISANLAPAEGYASAVEKILAQYDNELTRRWLMGALSELGLTKMDGELQFRITAEVAFPALKKIEATFSAKQRKTLTLSDAEMVLDAGQTLSVFSSYRFTLEQIREFLETAGVTVTNQWVNASGEEGLFLCKRRPD